mgnify:CR=1 FL=1
MNAPIFVQRYRLRRRLFRLVGVRVVPQLCAFSIGAGVGAICVLVALLVPWPYAGVALLAGSALGMLARWVLDTEGY